MIGTALIAAGVIASQVVAVVLIIRKIEELYFRITGRIWSDWEPPIVSPSSPGMPPLGFEGATRQCRNPLAGIVNLSRGGILMPSVARRFGAEKSLARL
jgi:hypothetical protein